MSLRLVSEDFDKMARSRRQQIDQTKGKESFEKLKDGVIKKEIAFFTITGSFKTAKGDSFPKTQVNEIPLVTCTDSSAYFAKENKVTKEIKVGIYSEKFDTTGHTFTYVNVPNPFLALIDNKPFWGTDGGIPKEKIKKVTLIRNKYLITLPDSALAGIYQPNFCNILSGKQTRARFARKLPQCRSRLATPCTRPLKLTSRARPLPFLASVRLGCFYC